MPQCRICGRKAESDYCFLHKPRFVKVNEDTKKDIDKMRNFFMEIWKKRKHYSEVSNTYLGKQPLTIYFHHILAKEKYPQAAFDEENIILLTFDEHTTVENDMYKYEKINEKRKYLLEKYA